MVCEACEVIVGGPEDLLRLDFEFLFFARDEGDDVVDDVHTADAGIAGSGYLMSV